MSYAAYIGSYSNWKPDKPYNHENNVKCAVMDTTQGQDNVQWMDRPCNANFGALCDLGPGNNTNNNNSKIIIVSPMQCIALDRV